MLIDALKKVYEVNNIGFYLGVTFLLLLILFVVVLVIGIREAKGEKLVRKIRIKGEKKENLKPDDKIMEDVTMENCILDERLINYKMYFEEQLSREFSNRDNLASNNYGRDVREKLETLDF